MDVLEAIYTRRSIRKYTGQPVGDEAVRARLKAGIIAPTAVDNRDWEFVVTRERAVLERLSDCLGHSGLMLKEAPLAIALCGDWDRAYRWGRDYWVEDCAAAAENILLAAHGMGLGAVWLGTYPQTDKMRRVAETLELPAHIIPFCVLSIGWPGEAKPAAADERYDEVKIHIDRW